MAVPVLPLPLVAAAALALPAPAADRCGEAPTATALLCHLNAARAVRGRPPLRADPQLARAARGMAHDMVARHYFAHVTPRGTTLGRRVARTGWMPRARSWWLGETLAWGPAGRASTPGAIVLAWLRSPPHRRVLLDGRYRGVGIGVAPGTPPGGPGRTFAADFGRR
jgi:uncharacterized protein YkwD